MTASESLLLLEAEIGKLNSGKIGGNMGWFHLLMARSHAVITPILPKLWFGTFRATRVEPLTFPPQICARCSVTFRSLLAFRDSWSGKQRPECKNGVRKGGPHGSWFARHWCEKEASKRLWLRWRQIFCYDDSLREPLHREDKSSPCHVPHVTSFLVFGFADSTWYSKVGVATRNKYLHSSSFIQISWKYVMDVLETCIKQNQYVPHPSTRIEETNPSFH